jgi:hypothetical protein
VTTTEGLSAAAEQYNVPAYYRQINRELRRAYAGQPLRVGQAAPSFRLPTVDGGQADLDQLRRDGHVVVIFGCYSAPPCVRELPEIDQLAAALPPGLAMVFIYTREIHPNEDLPYGRFAPHDSLAAKLAVARRFRDDLGLHMTVTADDLEGPVHRAYGGLPFCAAVVRRDGLLVHRSEWASAGQLAAVIANLAEADQRLAAGEQPRMSLSETLWSMERLTKKP